MEKRRWQWSAPRESFRRCAWISLLLAAAVLCFALLTATPTFYENDDANIALALSGARSGEPYASHPFINCILGFLVSGLYRVLPAVPWWGAVQIAAVALFTAISCFCVLRVSQRAGLPLPAALAAALLLAFSQLFYPLLLITFTLTSAAAGTAGVSLLLALDETDKPAERARMAAGSLVCLFFCFLFRNSSGYSMLCFYFGAFCYRLLVRLRMPAGGARAGLLRRAALFAACALSLALVTVLVHKGGLKSLNMPEFPAFDTARGNYMDYPRDSFAENPALYASVGWDEALYNAVERWCFMDARVNAETLSAIIAGSSATRASLSGALGLFVRFFETTLLARYLLLPSCCMLLCVLLLAPRGKEGLPARLAALGFFAGALALMLFLCLRERLILRTLQLVCMPLCAALICLAAGLWGKRSALWRRLACGALTLVSLFCAFRVQSEVRHYDAEPYLRDSEALIAYVLEHPENVYIADTHVANNVNARAAYPGAKPVNLMDWGGTGMYTGFWARQLARNGLDRFTADVFFEENVYFVTNPKDTDLAVFSAYLKSVYGDVTLMLAEKINEVVAVYRVTRGGEAAA